MQKSDITLTRIIIGQPYWSRSWRIEGNQFYRIMYDFLHYNYQGRDNWKRGESLPIPAGESNKTLNTLLLNKVLLRSTR